ncbi:hypothetical protein Hypma_005813 [Hypsizygus marmoreus]|uniref:Uncharacterized protein n=1 Tax=Hypsizygus marmoreus TaxID=39966 RepID=A0A369K7N0_HYPMA|nr:hypothetical protein Hypma_005813 [Hypsizygus marmoreus]
MDAQSSRLPPSGPSDNVIHDLSNTLLSALACITSRIPSDDGRLVLRDLALFDADIIRSIERTHCAQRVLYSTWEKVREFILTVESIMAPISPCLPPSHPRGDPSLLIYGQVCRQWRRAALMSPSLWSSIHIAIPQTLDNHKAEKLKNLINLVLERSIMCSLEIRLVIFPVAIPGESWPPQVTNDWALRTVFKPLLLHAHRWKDIELDITFIALKALFNDNPLSLLPAPRLETFHVTGEFGMHDTMRLLNNPLRPHISFASTPALRKVSLFHVGLLASTASSFAWDQLDELSLVGFFPGHFLFDSITTLQSCAKLTRCRLATSEHTRGFLNGVPIVLESLQYLHIDEHGVPDGGGDIYLHMVCPNLRELAIHFVVPARHNIQHHHLFWTRDSITTFLIHSPRLRRLELWDPPLDIGGLVQVLTIVPSLTHLTVGDLGSVCSFGNQLLHELTLPCSSSQESLLKHLEFIHIASRSFSEHFVVTLVESRQRKAESKFHHLQLHSPGTGLVSRLNHSLQKYRDSGLLLEISGSWYVFAYRCSS